MDDVVGELIRRETVAVACDKRHQLVEQLDACREARRFRVLGQLVDSLLDEPAAILVLAHRHQIVLLAKVVHKEGPHVDWQMLDDALEDVDGALIGAHAHEVETADQLDEC